jgi:phosphoribosylanthranilate isomerase
MNMKKIIKVCGMKYGDNIRDVEALGPDMIGFIFYRKSPRFVSEMPSYLPVKSKKAGVFVNAGPEEIMSKVDEYRLDYVQLHGSESPSFCDELCALGLSCDRIIKAFNISETFDFSEMDDYEGRCGLFLFDAKSDVSGGSGKRFDWGLLGAYSLDTPFLLSGGIGPDCVDELSLYGHPMLAGYDLNSRFELRPGLKDAISLKKFIDMI